jgi:hypothetical protein
MANIWVEIKTVVVAVAAAAAAFVVVVLVMVVLVMVTAVVVVALTNCSIFAFSAGITIWHALPVKFSRHLRKNSYVKYSQFTCLKDLEHRHTLLSRVTEYALPTVVYHLRNSMTVSSKVKNIGCETYLKAERTVCY